MSPGKRKRVTFAEESPVVHLIPAPESRGDGSEDDSGRKPADIQEALMAQRQGQDSMQELEDGSVMNDVAAAEEDYEQPAQTLAHGHGKLQVKLLMQAYNEAGVAFEPFHLRKERQEGFFDAEGNYIQYRLEEVKDAWLDSLKPDDVQTPAAAADGTVRPAKRQKSMLPAETEDLDADELHAYKRRLVDMLQPHETVLAALRRLGGVKRSGPAPAELSWKRVKKGRKSDDQSENGSSPTTRSAHPARLCGSVPVENRAEFDRLTEYSSLLLQHGDNDIYSTTPEEMAVQLEADEAAELQAVMGILSTAEQPIIDQAVAEELAAGQQAPVDPDEDIFGSTEPQPQPAMVVTDPAGTQSSAGQHTDQQVTSDASSSAVQVGVPSADSSFTFDQDSGTWFNADMGYYYDAAQGLYGDAASGHWYSYRDGAYQLVY